MGVSSHDGQSAHAAITAEQKTFLTALEDDMISFFEEQKAVLAEVSEESLPLLDSIRELSTGGKRLRALLAYWGWRGAGGAANAPDIVRAGVAIELFQSAALIHDDIIDNSDTRRGAPAVHKRFESMHARESWQHDGRQYGIASAILTGDLCLAMSETAFSSIGERAAWGTQARRIFDVMRAEVMAGQYLDVLNEVVTSENHEQALERAQRVIRYKSAKYSCEHPLAIGGALAESLRGNAVSERISAYRAFALPLGEGFQMRDDVLGVFGEPEVTGKPAGDDLREGKRTVLTALTEQAVDDQARAFLNASLGHQNLSDADITRMQALIADSGALARVEEMIEGKRAHVQDALAQLPVNEQVKTALSTIAAKALHRLS
ncbi:MULTISPECIES: polyprenyl synthetase family protein [unclassified Rothia (in: high G+C Gram-positive bacteria)]|uniref:polyprenyl synthetase family protein n=1 Tax=unclassified Rothia (in: high G+C Gram-positive bacteria) TaxID=2689056 RepID=UPI0019588639|nr:MULTISPECIES: polyprenyl synthetase family protein [unclassified Rothia (in: high G+C Gram-positive bacteria)]MBM7050769.1 polyprenyl synthetase family protein [Rothia sp. ZJ1223]QRZ60946.1 polyprenyl synthetase family protein [Rothia sp. ZJ932]